MKSNVRYWAIATLLVACGLSASAQSVWDTKHLLEVKSDIHQPYYEASYKALKDEADKILTAEPLSVMIKDRIPASGNKHDYMSLARYYWPDKTKPDGLPYISVDGVSNPELDKLDRNKLGTTAQRVITLALAWYFSDDEQYARKAAELLRVWFINKDTKMNPNLEYAQVAMGHNNNKGRGFGLIDGYSFVEMLDAVALLEHSKSLTTKDVKQLKQWFGDFTEWMLTSEQGIEEGNATNNHGVAYDAQIIAYSLFCGDKERAAKLIESIPEKRIFKQVEPDGRMPRELRRTLGFHYSQYNLTHFIDIMLMAKKIGRHIDNAESSDGRNFYKAMDFLASYMGKEVEQWPYKQISGWKESQQNFCRDLYRTATYLDTSRKDYLDMYSKYRILDVSDRFNLLYVKATDVDNAYIAASSQLRYAVDCAEKARKLESNMAENRVEPRTMNADGSVVLVNPRDWCSGFFPGNLWQMYSYTNDSYWRKEAVTWTWRIEDSKWYGGTHDLGFIMYNSFGKAYELTDERSYRDVVVDAANTLITRYNPTIKAIRSWDHNKDKWKYPVIIDNMMNLEMLFEATRLTGDSTYYKIAVQHANTTMRNHFRNDYSSCHVVDYEPSTGDVRARQTAQGYSDDSFWSRGQGWGLYGYVMCYRYTKDMAYLRQSERIADFFINLPNMPADMIPYWDMNMPSVKGLTPDNVDENIPRDASAAAVVASGLYELSLYVDNEKAERYRDVADKIINTLTRGYTSPIGENCGFLLLHSVGHYPAGSEVDVPLIYADYYYLEALSRKGKIDRGNK
jgi:hypothetical protein